MAVLLQFLGDALDVVLGNLDKLEWISVDNITGDVLFQKSDDFEGFSVGLDWSDEELVAVALIVLKLGWSGDDLVSSGLVPSKVVFGFLELLFESLSVFSWLSDELLVEVHDSCEGFNSFCADKFVGLVLSVSSELGIDVGLLQIVEESENCVDGIMSLGAGLKESKDLVLGGGSKTAGN